MPATLSRVVIGRDGELQMIIHPVSDSQLQTVREFSPVGSTSADVLRSSYSALTTDRALWALIIPVIASRRQILGDLLTQRIALIDAFAQLQTDRDLVATREDQWPSPTGPQQILINAAKVKVIQDLQDIQAIRDAIAAIKAQLN